MGALANGLQTPEPQDTDVISLDVARNRLAGAWIAGSLLIISLVVVQSNYNVYQGGTEDVWKWLFPAVLPTLTMILSVLASTALAADAPPSTVRKSFYRIALLLSVFYLLLILYTILIQPHSYRMIDDQLKAMRDSNLYLGPIQGLVASALAVLFVSKKSPK
jgi:hypothetical protein